MRVGLHLQACNHLLRAGLFTPALQLVDALLQLGSSCGDPAEAQAATATAAALQPVEAQSEPQQAAGMPPPHVGGCSGDWAEAQARAVAAAAALQLTAATAGATAGGGAEGGGKLAHLATVALLSPSAEWGRGVEAGEEEHVNYLTDLLLHPRVAAASASAHLVCSPLTVSDSSVRSLV